MKSLDQIFADNENELDPTGYVRKWESEAAKKRQAIRTFHQIDCACLDGGCSNPHPMRGAGVLQPPVPINPPTPREDDAITAAFNGARATIAKLESKPADYTAKVDALFAHAAKLGFTEQDFADLAVAAADQAGADLADQRHIAQLLGVDPLAARKVS